jgi:hypothetical protein
MSRILDREKALKLRKSGASYSQIKSILKVSKSTLSNWLHDFPLSKERISLLRDNNEGRIEKFRETMRQKRILKLDNILSAAKKKMLPLSRRELLLCGLFLYLGEGTKVAPSTLCITNTDPQIIKFTLFWFTKILKLPKDKIRIDMHLYNDMNIAKEINFWSKTLDLSPKHFNKPYIKNTSKEKINHKGQFGHGTCAITFFSVKIKDEVLMSIKAIIDKYS